MGDINFSVAIIIFIQWIRDLKGNSKKPNSANLVDKSVLLLVDYANAGVLAVRPIPKDFMTVIVVFKVGFPSSLKERYSCARDRPVSTAI